MVVLVALNKLTPLVITPHVHVRAKGYVIGAGVIYIRYVCGPPKKI